MLPGAVEDPAGYNPIHPDGTETGAPPAQDAMPPLSEPDDPLLASPADRSPAAVERLEIRCAELDSRLGESEAEKRALAARLERLQAEFDRMESQLLTILSGKAFRYSRGARRFWARFTGG